MSGDYSRNSFNALRDFAGVFLQQGRAALDADWNEMVAIFERRLRAETVDIIGRGVVPRETPLGFEIQPGAVDGAQTLGIGRGRKYLDGLLLECHGAAAFSGDEDLPPPAFDRARQNTTGSEGVLDELIAPQAGDFLRYDRQPYWPTPDPLPPGDGQHLVYVVAWQREVTPLEDPSLLEPALGGIDTGTRWQTVWQVRLHPNLGDNVTCASPDTDIGDWPELIAPSSARLSSDTIDIEDPEDPCLVPPSDGYVGVENQFYRVELHVVGDAQEDARFKYSRENASVVAAIDNFADPAERITVHRIGRDEILRFRAGDWVEITDDRRELNQRSGQMLRVANVNEETREIELEGTIDGDFVPSGVDGDTPQERRSRVIRWDQHSQVRLADGTEWDNLDAAGSDGLIRVPPPGVQVVLESGIVVSFDTAAGDGAYREMDYWQFAARTAGTQIERLRQVPPRGIQRHYCRLAIVRFPNTVVDDCRVFWPPLFDAGEGCACTLCVTPEGHNSGVLTIQAAINQVGANGGTVCLDGGNYNLGQTPVVISGRQALTLRGQGMRTLLLYRGGGGAIRITGSIDVQIEDLSVVVSPNQEDDIGNLPPRAAGVRITHALGVALRGLVLLVTSSADRQDHGIALEGVGIALKVEETFAIAQVALGAYSERDRDNDDGPGYLALSEFRLLDNILLGGAVAVRMEGLALNLTKAQLSRNLIWSQQRGLGLNWLEPPTGSTTIDGNTLLAGGDGLTLGVGNLRLQDNEISAGPQSADGVRLVEGLAPELQMEAQVIGNRIGDLAGVGLHIAGPIANLLVKRNLIRRCGVAGILTAPDAIVQHIAVDNNVIEAITGAGAIMLTRIAAARIVGNNVQSVGEGSDPGGAFAGMAVQGVTTLAVDSNMVSKIGPNSAGSPAVAILVRAPLHSIQVSGNQLAGSTTPDDVPGAGWMGLDIGSAALGGGGLVAEFLGSSVAEVLPATLPGGDETALAFFAVEEQTFALSRFRLTAVGRSRDAQITIKGNQMHHASNTALPMVLVNGGSSSCIFSDNQCRLTAAGKTPALALLVSARVVAANNVVRRESDLDAMIIGVERERSATVLGNLTFGNIRVEPGGLQPPFSELNLLSS